MLTLHVHHPNGHAYDIPAQQVVIRDHAGRALAVTYIEAGLIVHCRTTDDDWRTTCARLSIEDR